MDWLWWLLAPMMVTLTAAVLTWWVNRPRREPSMEQAIIAHRRFLADLERYSPSAPVDRHEPAA